MSRVYQAVKVTYAQGTVKSELLGYPTTNFAELITSRRYFTTKTKCSVIL